MIDVLAQQIINGLVVASVYMMFSVGLSLIYGVFKIFHIAHGAAFLIGLFATYYGFLGTGNLPVAILIGLAFSALFGIGNAIIYRRTLSRGATATLVSSIGLYMLTQESFIVAFNPEPKHYNFTFLPIDIAGAKITNLQVAILIIGVISVASLWFFLQRSWAGKSIRAVAQDVEASKIMGISADRTLILVMILGSVLAGLGGTLTSLNYNLVQHGMGFSPIAIGFVIILLGGMGSYGGAIVASLIIGFSETLASVYLAVFSRHVISFGLLTVLLILRPKGLRGK